MTTAPIPSTLYTKRDLQHIVFRFGGGLGAFQHDDKNPRVVAILTNGDDRFGYLMPGPREEVDVTGIAAGFRVVGHVKHNNVDMLATTNSTDSKTYRLEAGVWALKETILNAVATGIWSFHDGTNASVAVGFGSTVAFRYSTNDGTAWTSSTLAGNAKYITRAYTQQNGPSPRVAYCVDPNIVYFANGFTNTATVTTAENIGTYSTSDAYFTSMTADNQGNLVFGTRHLLYRRVQLSDGSILYEPVSPYYDDNQGDAGGQSDRKNFEQYIDLDGRLFYIVHGYTLGMWYDGQWSADLEPRQTGDEEFRLPRLDLPINAIARAGQWIVLALGSKNTGTLKNVANAPGGSNLLQNSFATTSELYLGRILTDARGHSQIRWYGSVLTCTSALRFMWFSESDSYLYLASGDSELVNLQQRRCLLYTVNPLTQNTGGVVKLNTGTVTAEFGRVNTLPSGSRQVGLGRRKLLQHASLRATGLTSVVTAAIKYRNESGRNTTAPYKTHATYTGVEGAARGTVFPTSRIFEECWFQVVLNGDATNNLYATVEYLTVLADID